MRLYIDVPTPYAQRVIAEGGFTGEHHLLFRDKLRSGPAFTVSDDEVIADEPFGVVLSIDVPDGVALARYDAKNFFRLNANIAPTSRR